MTEDATRQSTNLASLRREWGWVLAANLTLLAGAAWLMRGGWSDPGAWRAWLGVASAILAYQLFHLWRNLSQNFAGNGQARLFPTLGLGNWITLLRSALLALLSGFLLTPRPEGWAAWAPGGLYLAAALMDYLDGWAARATGRASRLGEILDMHWDGYGVLVACILLVMYGQAPAWYVLVGLARYLFVAGLWLRERRGQPIYAMQPSMIRRALAGAQMGFIAAILLPVFTPPTTLVAATIFMLPLLGSFLRDWLVVSGVVKIRDAQEGARPFWERWAAPARAWLPLFLRGLAVALLLAAIWSEATHSRAWGLLLVGGCGLALIGLGVAGRLAALAVMLMSGFVLRNDAQNLLYWAVLLAGTGVLLVGTGKYSLWKPEEWLIYHRPGEARQTR